MTLHTTRSPRRSTTRTRTALAAAIAAFGLAHGCSTTIEDQLVAPQNVVAPYSDVKGEVLWAVVPLRNETGTTHADPLAISDQLVAAVEQVRGVRCVPLNRIIETMRALELASVSNPADVKKLAAAMGVDGVVVGSVTAYDPYTPSLGLSLALFARSGAMTPAADAPTDPRLLAVQPTEAAPARGNFASTPVATASEYLDAKNHQVLLDVKAFAQGRHRATDALGWRRYTASMPLFCEFAATHTVGKLLEREWIRMGVTKSTAGRAAPVRTADATKETR